MNHYTSRGGHGFKPSDIQILFALELLEPLPTMHQLENSILGFSLMKISNAHVMNILLRLEDIYSMNAEDLTGTGTLEEI